MSTLAAVYSVDGRPADLETLAGMLDTVPHTWPDGRSHHLDGGTGLAVGLMRITAEDRNERQPVACRHSGAVVIADAHLHNREELLSALPGAKPNAGDAEIILQLFVSWGVAGLRRIVGDFATVIWRPDLRQLICARDGGGQRPLFYRRSRNAWIVGSSIEELLVEPENQPQPDEETILDWLTPCNVYRNERQTPRTFFQDIHSIPAGEALIIDAEGIRKETFWAFTPPQAIRYRHHDEYLEHFQKLFSRVIASHLRCDGPRGILLSGGVDSAAIACAAAERLGDGASVSAESLHSFTFTYPGLNCDEAPLVRELQITKGFEGTFIPYEGFRSGFAAPLPAFLEAPNCGILEAQAALYGAAQSRGIRLLVNGDCAEGSVSGGWMMLDGLLRRFQMMRAWRHLQACRRIASPRSARAVLWEGIKGLLPPLLKAPINRYEVKRSYRLRRLALLPKWFSPRLLKELRDRNLDQCLRQIGSGGYPYKVTEEQAQMLYPPPVARRPASWGVQLSRPYMDRRLHEFLLGIPAEKLFDAGPDTPNTYAAEKQLVRQAFAGKMPDSIRLQQHKTIFSQSFVSEVDRQFDALALTFNPIHGESRIAASGWVDAPSFWGRLLALREGQMGDDFPYLQRMLDLETWLRWLEIAQFGSSSKGPNSAVSGSTACVMASNR